MTDRFVSENIRPIDADFDTRFMATGGPGVPQCFKWRKETVAVQGVLRTWHETGPCRNGSPEHYVRKHWFEIQTLDHGVMRIYFERQPRDGKVLSRWWLFSILGYARQNQRD